MITNFMLFILFKVFVNFDVHSFVLIKEREPLVPANKEKIRNFPSVKGI